MNPGKKPSVLVCVTGQHSCDRLIRKGYKKAKEAGMALHVLSVHDPREDFGEYADDYEYLCSAAKDCSADMTILFEKNAPAAAAGFARNVNANKLITGMPDGRPNGFIVLLHELLPTLQLTMVTKSDECVDYCVGHSDRAYA